MSTPKKGSVVTWALEDLARSRYAFIHRDDPAQKEQLDPVILLSCTAFTFLASPTGLEDFTVDSTWSAVPVL